MPEEIYSVSDLTADIRGSLEQQFQGIWIEGEVSNHRLPGSGHHYFTLKDSFAQISCVLFKGAARKNRIVPQDGMKIQLYGDVSVYEARGQYQVIAQVIQPAGSGDLQAKFEELKRKLEAEGLFSSEKKKPLPAFPTSIGIVTSPTGAAIRDILHVLRRRAPWIRIVIQPVRVQGEGAAEEIAQGIQEISEGRTLPPPELVLVTRGGGSIEDLWSFNEEVVARAIAACPIPVLSGVGHEIDFTIADFVADRREPTPSAAAENATPDVTTLLHRLSSLQELFDSRSEAAIESRRREVRALEREVRAHEPRRRLQSRAQELDYLRERMEGILINEISERRHRCQHLGSALHSVSPERSLEGGRRTIAFLGERLQDSANHRLQRERQRSSALGELLRSLSPEMTIRRGYSLTTDEKGNLITSTAQVESGNAIRTRLADGEIQSRVE